jgi:hypothetical protein
MPPPEPPPTRAFLVQLPVGDWLADGTGEYEVIGRL